MAHSAKSLHDEAVGTDLTVGFTPGTRTERQRIEIEGFARRLHEFMARKGMSQSDLARAVWGKDTDTRGYEVAKNRDRISSYLRGRSIPEPANMKTIADKLGVTVAELAPDVLASVVDRAHPAVSMSMVAGHSDKTHLQVNKLVPMAVAAKIIALLSEDEKP
jgi:hypothetical protein